MSEIYFKEYVSSANSTSNYLVTAQKIFYAIREKNIEIYFNDYVNKNLTGRFLFCPGLDIRCWHKSASSTEIQSRIYSDEGKIQWEELITSGIFEIKSTVESAPLPKKKTPQKRKPMWTKVASSKDLTFPSNSQASKEVSEIIMRAQEQSTEVIDKFLVHDVEYLASRFYLDMEEQVKQIFRFEIERRPSLREGNEDIENYALSHFMNSRSFRRKKKKTLSKK